MEKKKLGILGGMGSEATVLFYKKIIDNTSVNNDREHLDILIYNHASIPDRTECILCGKQDYLWDIIANDIRGMEQLLGLTDAQIDQVFQKALAGLLFKVAADV